MRDGMTAKPPAASCEHAAGLQVFFIVTDFVKLKVKARWADGLRTCVAPTVPSPPGLRVLRCTWSSPSGLRAVTDAVPGRTCVNVLRAPPGLTLSSGYGWCLTHCHAARWHEDKAELRGRLCDASTSRRGRSHEQMSHCRLPVQEAEPCALRAAEPHNTLTHVTLVCASGGRSGCDYSVILRAVVTTPMNINQTPEMSQKL